ncbi:MAG: hypothetical protein ABIB43_02980 [archaeon]
MINKKYIEVLRILSEKLKSVKWVLIGSTNLVLQGVDVEANDIDVLTDKEDAFKVGELLKEFEVKPVAFGEKYIFRSYYGLFEINGIEVEVMGELEELIDGEWTSSYVNEFDNAISWKLNGFEISIASLEDELEDYKKLNRDKDQLKIKKIEEKLRE